MIGEFSFFGLYFPVLMVTALVAFFVTRLLCTFIASRGWYRHIWHPPLFDIALYLAILGLFVILFNHFRHYIV